LQTTGDIIVTDANAEFVINQQVITNSVTLEKLSYIFCVADELL